MEQPEFVHLIKEWYKIHKRDLPWRAENDPYKIWLSEILLQQTRVNQGLPYYYKFINEFPNITSLAICDEQKILRLWQGLGYYSRARNLHFTAKLICDQYNGKFPDCYKSLLKLKGIGEYTAAAIASFAFREKVAVVDGNVFRVLSRVFGIYDLINSTEGKKKFRQLAENLLPDQESEIYNQAIMEFGALQCTPANPGCANCPVSHFCSAFAKGDQKILPAKSKALAKKTRYFHYSIYTCNNKILMQPRTGKDIWKGLFQFPVNENTLKQENQLMNEPLPTYKHILSHQVIEATFKKIALNSEKELRSVAEKLNSQIYNMDEVENLPKPVLINNYLKQHFF